MKKTSALLLAGLLLLSSCASESAASLNSTESNASGSTGLQKAAVSYAVADNSSSSASVSQQQKIITTADLTIQTKEIDSAIQSLETLVQSSRGTIIYSSTNGDGYTYDGGTYARTASYQIRIPAEGFDAFVTSCKKLGNVTSSDMQTQDVTDAYIDNDAHLDALKAQQQKLQELMNKAENVSDLLAIQSQMSDVEYQISSYESIKKNYDTQINSSTLTLTLKQVDSYTQNHPSFWQSLGQSFGSAFRSFLNVLESIVIFLVYLIPYILIILALVWLIRWQKKHRKNHAGQAK